jgi:hypothetical protein
MGMTQTEYRNKLTGEIAAAYRKIVTLEKKMSRPSATDSKREEWNRQLVDLKRKLHLAFDKLPEVRLTNLDMTAIEFAKELITKKPNPKFLASQMEAF